MIYRLYLFHSLLYLLLFCSYVYSIFCLFFHYYVVLCCVFFFFFFSSRRRHTRSDRDWSSDVCSSDLYHRKPSAWLFPGNRDHGGDRPIDTKTVWYACQKAAKRAGIQKDVHPHTLRDRKSVV